MTAPLPVDARGLTKRYGAVTAVDAVDLAIDSGGVLGYLGPNGAGKTTSLRMLLGLIRPDEGTVRLFGRDPMEVGARALDGVAGFVEAPRFYPYLSGRRNLEMLAALDGDGAADRIDEALGIAGLTARAGDRVGGYSQGMVQRLGIAGALLRDPRLLVLDEPATGLDPAGMRDVRRLVAELAAGGITVLLSSHLMSEVQELCDRVVILGRGRVLFDGPLEELLASSAGRYELRSTDDRRAAEVARGVAGVHDVVLRDDGVAFAAPEAAAAELSLALARAGIGTRALVPRSADLEALFLGMTEPAEVVA
jgi:ABC-2 type transport system ATP-binding protein